MKKLKKYVALLGVGVSFLALMGCHYVNDTSYVPCGSSVHYGTPCHPSGSSVHYGRPHRWHRDSGSSVHYGTPSARRPYVEADVPAPRSGGSSVNYGTPQ